MHALLRPALSLFLLLSVLTGIVYPLAVTALGQLLFADAANGSIVSVDGKAWKKVLDFSKDTVPATAAGYSGKFPQTEARYVRINMLKNSANPFVHIVELIVDETK